MKDIRICNTEDLLILLRHAKAYGFNRTLDPEGLDIDPDGKHILGLVLYGHNIDQSPVLHHRVHLLVKITGEDEPYEVLFDISDDDWKHLMTVEDYKARVSS